MGSLCLWLAVVAAGLLWTAALTAAADEIAEALPGTSRMAA